MQTSADMVEKETSGGPPRVLVAAQKSTADDISLVSWLKHEGFEVMTAIDEQEALQIAGSLPGSRTSF
jgi:uncharacterized protein (DUF302 family)